MRVLNEEWDLNSRAGVVMPVDAVVNRLVFSPDGRYLAFVKTAKPLSTSNKVEIWDANNGRQVVEINLKENRLYRLGFSPDGKYLATTSLKQAYADSMQIKSNL